MRFPALRPAAILGAALTATALLAAGRPAAAQAPAPSITLRLGGYFNSNTTVRHTVGSSLLAAGLDYDVQKVPGVSRTIASVDYIDRSSNNNVLRVFPVTVGQIVLGANTSGIQPYYGGGVGAYFIHQDLNRNDAANRNSHDAAAFGGYAVAGLEFNHFLVAEARYHLVTSEHGIDVSGLELTGGIRF